MQHYRVVVKVYAPYPIETEHTIKASRPWVAASAGVKAAYAALPTNRRRRVDNYIVTIKRL